MSKHEEAEREHKGAEGEHEGATREHVDETGLSGGAKRHWVRGNYIYICKMSVYT